MTTRHNVVGSAIFGSRIGSRELHPARQKLFNQMERDPWAFLTAVDPLTNEPVVWTRNERSPRGRDPFPNKEYLSVFVRKLIEEPVLYVPKSRQMIISTCCLAVCLWEILFKQSWRTILSKVTESEAEELIANKVRFTYDHLPEWFKKLRTVPDKPKGKAECLETRSYIIAAAQNVADRECRGGTANRVVIDEACYQDYTRNIVEAGQPMTDRLVAISTPNVSYPGGRFMKSQIYDE